MGYAIMIGNGILEHDEELVEPRWVVEPAELLGKAPKCQNTWTNYLHASYSGWAEFCDKVGLRDLFLGAHGLLSVHPGLTPITNEHLAQVEAAMKRWQVTMQKTQEDHTMLTWLRWLDFWMRWARDTCEHPAIYNR